MIPSPPSILDSCRENDIEQRNFDCCTCNKSGITDYSGGCCGSFPINVRYTIEDTG